jgi:hypothetical protein
VLLVQHLDKSPTGIAALFEVDGIEHFLAERQSSLVPRDCAARAMDRNFDVNLKCSRVRYDHHGALARRVRRPTVAFGSLRPSPTLGPDAPRVFPYISTRYTNPDASQGQPRRLERTQPMSATRCSTDGFVRRDVRGHWRVEGLNGWQIAVEALYLHGRELSCASLRQ